MPAHQGPVGTDPLSTGLRSVRRAPARPWSGSWPALDRLVAGLDTALPLTMFPVRLATRLHRPVPTGPPTELWLRIFPDLIHADGHLPELSAAGDHHRPRLLGAALARGRRRRATRRRPSWATAQLGAAPGGVGDHADRADEPGRRPKRPVPDGEPLRTRAAVPEAAPAHGDPPDAGPAAPRHLARDRAPRRRVRRPGVVGAGAARPGDGSATSPTSPAPATCAT